MNEKKLNIRTALTGVVGYLIGSTVYRLLNIGNSKSNFLIAFFSGVVVAAIIGILDHLYIRKKYPKLLKVMAAEAGDERGKLILGKASTYTLFLIAFLTAGLFIYSVVNDYETVSYIIGSSYVVTVVFFIIVNNHLNKTI